MACLLVGSGVSLVANAATNFWPSNFEDWQRENLFVAGTGGNVLDLRGDPPKLGSAVKQITLVGGRTYRITGTLIWRPSFSDSRITIGLITGNDEEVILCYFDGVSRNIEVDVEFTVPSNNQVEMAILIYGRSTVTFNDFVLEDDSTDKGILNSIKEGFAKLWEWLKGIWDSIKEIPQKLRHPLRLWEIELRIFFRVWGIESAIFLLIYGIGSKHSFCLRRAFSMNIPQNSMCLLIAILVFWLICLMNYLSSFRRS